MLPGAALAADSLQSRWTPPGIGATAISNVNSEICWNWLPIFAQFGSRAAHASLTVPRPLPLKSPGPVARHSGLAIFALKHSALARLFRFEISFLDMTWRLKVYSSLHSRKS